MIFQQFNLLPWLNVTDNVLLGCRFSATRAARATQRGGSPTPADRLLSARFGVAAVEMAARGEFGQMAALRGGAIVQVPLTEACAKMKTVDPQGELVHVARSIGISFGDA